MFNNICKKKISVLMAVVMSVVTILSGTIVSKVQNVKAQSVTTVYFLNTKSWTNIYAYVYMDGNNSVLGSWPGTKLVRAEEQGDNWWKVDVPEDASKSRFNIIISASGSETERVEATISTISYIYITGNGSKLYSSVAAAEIDAGIRENPANKDYGIDMKGVGANVPYKTYQAEKADTNATKLAYSTEYMSSVQSEASGREAVRLSQTGDFVEFTLQEKANAMVVRYCIPDSSDGKGTRASLSMYVDGQHNKDVNMTSEYAWVYGYYPYYNTPSQGRAHRFFDESRLMFGKTLEKGTKIKLQKDQGDNAEYYIIDFIECEMADTPIARPQNTLSISEFGAIADDDGDDYSAIVSCINAAKSRGMDVWIPEGRFINNTTKSIYSDGVTIKGAGMWYSEIYGSGAAFTYAGSSGFYDFAITGDRTIRRDSEDPAAFGDGARSNNVVIENIWMEHVKVGVWSGSVDGLKIHGCRIRDTYADGINLCSSTVNARVENNNIRNTGDDGLAIWPWMGNCTGNVITKNTVQLPMLANCYAVYGGGDNRFTYNIAEDSVNNGSGFCVGSDYDTSNGYTGETEFSNNVLVRCGSLQTDYNYPIGAVWIWGTKYPINGSYKINNNRLVNSSYEGILVDGYSDITGLELFDNVIYGCSDGVYVRGTSSLNLSVRDIAAVDCRGNLLLNEATNANLSIINKGVYASDGTHQEEPDNTEPDTTEPDTTEETVIYLYNNSGWKDIYAYAYCEHKVDILGAWKGIKMTEEKTLGEGWWKITVPQSAQKDPFNIIFHDNGSQTQRAEVYIDRDDANYVLSQTGTLFNDLDEAKTAAGIAGSPQVEIRGYQLNNLSEGFRTSYRIINPDDTVKEVGLIYGLADRCSEEEMYVGSTNSTVHSYPATSKGIIYSSVDEDGNIYDSYNMTMKYGISSYEFFDTKLIVRAYVKLADGRIIYSETDTTSVFEVADDIYSNGLASERTMHEYLYDRILHNVDSSYAKKEYF